MRYSRSQSRNRSIQKDEIDVKLSSQITNLFCSTKNDTKNSDVLSTDTLTYSPKFECILAHGSSVAFVSSFKNLPELYINIAKAFNISPEDILYCTANTMKIDPSTFITNNVNFGDVIYAHIKGQRKEVQITKTGEALGITITDNGAGYCFVKKIKLGSTSALAFPAISIGDHIEKINGATMVGMTHCNVARVLRNIAIGESFIVRLIEPYKTGFSHISTRSSRIPNKTTIDITSGTGTLRFKANGDVVIQEAPDKMIISAMNDIFDSYLGLHDDELALSIWELGRDCQDVMELTKKINESEINIFEFPDELIFDMWGVIDDFRKSRLSSQTVKSD
ncbi:GH21964p [Strongyloides ratti]|uniref:GH21964p n=1 Tax=Strongyloides ratti TaxID=34506 RepID=A0A090LJ69_STRRB|nr:GH21964p [Strongyloides ratti]CEF67580.1 GH21964p [Strongyloides ratti]